MFLVKRRITNIPISPEDIIERNLRFFQNPNVYYEAIHSYHRTKWEIEKQENENKLKAVFDDFPYDEPVDKQCAYWVRAISGIHPFPDANHRTATATLLVVTDYGNDFGIETLTEDSMEEDLIDETVKQSKMLKRGSDSITVSVKNLRKEDELFNLWRKYFEFVLWKRYFGYEVQ